MQWYMPHKYDKFFEALANEHRRQILFSLLAEPSPVDIDSPPDPVRERQISLIKCHHVHLPKLTDYGFVRWTPGTNTVEKGPQFGEIEPLLELFDDHRDRLFSVPSESVDR